MALSDYTPSLPSIPQTSVIAAALLIGFIVFITLKQQLGAYLSILLGGGNTASSATVQTQSGQLAPTTPTQPTAGVSTGGGFQGACLPGQIASASGCSTPSSVTGILAAGCSGVPGYEIVNGECTYTGQGS